jgi:excisionase family DNA binding protein
VERLGSSLTHEQPEHFMVTKPDVNTRRWITVEQLLEIVPLKKSRLYYLTHTRQIPFVRLGATLLFDYDAIVEWMESHGQPVGVPRKA